TVTVYEKGAEVVRLYHSLLGEHGFRKGMDLYFERHDGQAVTTEDFLAAMADANAQDLSAMQSWYEQAGTPRLSVRLDYHAEQQSCTIHFSQTCPTTPEKRNKKPFLIPITLALFASNGKALPLQLEHEDTAQDNSRTLLLDQEKQSFTFTHIPQCPTPSLLRGFSAPVTLDYPYTAADYAFLMQYETDDFNRWAASQALATQSLLNMMQDQDNHHTQLCQAFTHLLQNPNISPALKAEALILPSIAEISEALVAQGQAINPALIQQTRQALLTLLAQNLEGDLQRTYAQMSVPFSLDDKAMQQRKLKNVCLTYLATLHNEKQGEIQGKSSIQLIYQQFEQADNMTDQYAALATLANTQHPQRQTALNSFEQQWAHESNVMDKWFAVQASSSLPDVLTDVKKLLNHPAFDIRNPNKVRALIGSFAMRNHVAFHAEDGSGYKFVAEQVCILDKLNPQIAARIVRALMDWKRLEPTRQKHMKQALQNIADSTDLSGDVFEIVSKSLQVQAL
ncbi:MAG: DUF3458 domain-containing protein, partial [Mariprofundaceae bacterium]|nr:DUF3458 domain-containing protein [Mariprofundaceae bacterium]